MAVSVPLSVLVFAREHQETLKKAFDACAVKHREPPRTSYITSFICLPPSWWRNWVQHGDPHLAEQFSQPEAIQASMPGATCSTRSHPRSCHILHNTSEDWKSGEADTPSQKQAFPRSGTRLLAKAQRNIEQLPSDLYTNTQPNRVPCRAHF